MNDLKSKMARGAVWMGLLRFSVRGIGLVSIVILARLLVPADFGLIAMATSLIAFLELATAFGFDIPIIQKRHAGREYFDTAWTLTILFRTILTIILLVLAHPASAFYGEPRLVGVVYALAIGFFVSGFENIGIVEYRKNLDFQKDFVLMLCKKLAGFSITIPLAFVLRSYWALVAGMVLSNVVGVLLSYGMHHLRPRLSLVKAKEMIDFSKWLLVNNFVSYLRMKSPIFIIGRISGSDALGLFTVSFEISKLPTTELVSPINRVVFPGYATLSDDLSNLAKVYTDTLAVIALFALPAGLGLAALSENLVSLFLGSKWTGAAPIIAILAIFGGVNAVQANNGSIYNALGKPYIGTLVGIANVSVLLAASITMAISDGVEGVATAYMTVSIVMAPIGFYVVCRFLRMPFYRVLAELWRPITASILMYVVIRYVVLEGLAEGRLSNVVSLLIGILTGAFVYIALMVFLWVLAGQPRSADLRFFQLIIRKITHRTKATG